MTGSGEDEAPSNLTSQQSDSSTSNPHSNHGMSDSTENDKLERHSRVNGFRKTPSSGILGKTTIGSSRKFNFNPLDMKKLDALRSKTNDDGTQVETVEQEVPATSRDPVIKRSDRPSGLFPRKTQVSGTSKQPTVASINGGPQNKDSATPLQG